MRRIFLIITILAPITLFAQSERHYVRKGNRLFNRAVEDTMMSDTVRNENFSLAEAEYLKALDEAKDNKDWKFNLATSQLVQANFDEALPQFEELAKDFEDSKKKGMAHYNYGLGRLSQYLMSRQQQGGSEKGKQNTSEFLDQSIEAFESALINSPSNGKYKYNLMYAKALKEQNQNNQNQDQNQDKQNKDNQDQNKDKDKQDQDKDNQDKNKGKDKQDQENKDDKQKQDQDKQDNKDKQEQQQRARSKDDAKRILDALGEQEKRTRAKVEKAKEKEMRAIKTEKEW
ncbi:MAG: hypothetical protein ACK5L5_03850 [Bacteroidales bacterium]